MPFPKDKEMIQAFAPYYAYPAFRIRVKVRGTKGQGLGFHIKAF